MTPVAKLMSPILSLSSVSLKKPIKLVAAVFRSAMGVPTIEPDRSSTSMISTSFFLATPVAARGNLVDSEELGQVGEGGHRAGDLYAVVRKLDCVECHSTRGPHGRGACVSRRKVLLPELLSQDEGVDIGVGYVFCPRESCRIDTLGEFRPDHVPAPRFHGQSSKPDEHEQEKSKDYQHRPLLIG